MPGLFGLILIGIGLVHTFVGLVLGKKWVVEILRAGFGAVSQRSMSRLAIFWFLWAGFAWIITGHHLFWLERTHGIGPPSFLIWELLGYAVVGAFLQPKSGFPAVIAILAAWLAFA